MNTPTGTPPFPCMRGAGWGEGAPPACAGTEPDRASKLQAEKGLIRDLATLSLESTGPPLEGPGLRTRAHARGLGRAEPARGRRSGRCGGGASGSRGAYARAPLAGTRPARSSRFPLRLLISRPRRRRGSPAFPCMCMCVGAAPPSGARRPSSEDSGVATGSWASGHSRFLRVLQPTPRRALASVGSWLVSLPHYVYWENGRHSINVYRTNEKSDTFHLECKGRPQSYSRKRSLLKLWGQPKPTPTLRHSLGHSQGKVTRAGGPRASLAVVSLDSISFAAPSESSDNAALFLHPSSAKVMAPLLLKSCRVPSDAVAGPVPYVWTWEVPLAPAFSALLNNRRLRNTTASPQSLILL